MVPAPPKFLFFAVSGYSVHADVEAGVQVRMEPGNSQISVTVVEESFALHQSSSTANRTDFGYPYQESILIRSFLASLVPEMGLCHGYVYLRDAESAELKKMLLMSWAEKKSFDHIFTCINPFYGSNFPDFRDPLATTTDIWIIYA